VVYTKRLFRSWVRTLSLEDLPEDYLRAMLGMKGWRGPLQGAYARFRSVGVRMKGAACWILGGREYRIGASQGLQAALEGAARSHEWSRLSRQRKHYVGLHAGRDDALSDALSKKLGPKEQALLGYLQADGVYTPWRAHNRQGRTGACRLCGHSRADWSHLRGQCGRERRPEWCPVSLWLTGNVGNDFGPAPRSLEMEEAGGWADGPVVSGDLEAGTDGSCQDLGWGDRAGWGVVFATARGAVTLSGPVPGDCQIAQRAECWALLQALCGCTGMVRVVTDSAYVCGMVQLLFECYGQVARAHRAQAKVASSGGGAPAGAPPIASLGSDGGGWGGEARLGPYGDGRHTVRGARGVFRSSVAAELADAAAAESAAEAAL